MMKIFASTKHFFWEIVFVTVFFLISTHSTWAATYTVSKTADTSDGTCDADCSLREAIVAANANSGVDTIEFNIPTSDGGYTSPAGDIQGYFTITTTTLLTLSDNSGVYINGYSQSGASRNTVAFGGTLNTILKIQLFTNLANAGLSLTGGNNHITGLNIKTLRTSNGSMNVTSSSNNWIEGNFIGSNIVGTSSQNGGGFEFTTSSNNVVGTNGDGTGDSGEINLFLGSAPNYVRFDSSGNILAGNYLGVDRTSRTCTTGTLSASAVELKTGGSNLRIGTNYDGISDATESNIIGCVNSGQRAHVRLSGVSNSTIQGNYLGTNYYNDNLSSGLTGRPIIVIRDSQNTNNTIKKNVIAFAPDNAGIQMLATTPSSYGNTFSQNTIYNNFALGIAINDGNTSPTINDAGDVDSGLNDFMNYPVLRKVCTISNGVMNVHADLDFKYSEGPFTIEFFDNDALDSTGYGEGQYFIGSVTTSTRGSDVSLNVPITGRTPASASKITATATNANGSTSEFSASPSNGTFDNSCAGTSSSSSATTASQPEGYEKPITVGPNAPGPPSFIGGGGEASNAQTYIDKTASSHDLYISISAKTADELSHLPIPILFPWSQGLRVVGDIYDFQSLSAFNGYPLLDFDRPVTIIIPYDPMKLNGISPQKLRIAWYDEASRRWKIISSNTVINWENHTLANTTKRFSYFTVVYP